MTPDALPRFALRSIAYSQWAYWCSLGLAAFGAIYVPAGSVRTLLIVTPILPALLCAAVVYWLYEASDEYLKLRILKSVAMTAVAVGLATLTYFCLELAGYPRLSMVWVSLIGWSVLNLQIILVMFRAR